MNWEKKWTRCLKVESIFTDHGRKIPEIKLIPLDQVDVARSDKIQTRLTSVLHEDWVEKYKLAMENGTRFPAGVVWKEGDKYVIYAGRHRFAASKASGEKEMAFYVSTDNDPFIKDLVSRTLNLMEGNPESEEFAVLQAEYFLTKHSMTQSDAAKIFGLKEPRLRSHMRVQKLREKLRENGFKADSLGDSLVERLGPLEKHMPVMIVTAQMAREYNLTVPQTIDLVKQVLEYDSEAKQLMHLKRFKDRHDKIDKPQQYEEKPRRPITTPLRDRVFKAMTALIDLFDSKNHVAYLQIYSKQDKDDFTQDAVLLMKQLRKLLKSVERKEVG